VYLFLRECIAARTLIWFCKLQTNFKQLHVLIIVITHATGRAHQVLFECSGVSNAILRSMSNTAVSQCGTAAQERSRTEAQHRGAAPQLCAAVPQRGTAVLRSSAEARYPRVAPWRTYPEIPVCPRVPRGTPRSRGNPVYPGIHGVPRGAPRFPVAPRGTSGYIRIPRGKMARKHWGEYCKLLGIVFVYR
jgi:hypothetical protein